MKKRIYTWFFISVCGWKIEGPFPTHISKMVLMVLPHTHWFDFFLGLFTRGIIGVDMHWVGKKELFRFPFGAYFRWMGGRPLDRRGNQNLVESMIDLFNNTTELRLAIAPEGTRKKVYKLKTGYYYVALGAQVPIVPVAFDFKARAVRFGDPFMPTGNYEVDLPHLMQHFTGAIGKIPAYSFETKQSNDTP